MNKRILILGIVAASILLTLLFLSSGCIQKGNACCSGGFCSAVELNCISGTSPRCSGCDERCMPICACERNGNLPINEGPEPSLIKRSVPQGDFMYDNRNSDNACSSILPEVQVANPGLNCSLVQSKRVDYSEVVDLGTVADIENTLKDMGCVDGASITGCFACTFECKK